MEILPHLHLWVSNVIPYPNRNNLLGKQVGGLKVIFDCGVDRNGKNIVWLCSCQCGNLSLQRGGDLSLGRVKSCGCGKRHLPKGESRFRHVLARYKIQAKQRKISFDLTVEQARELMSKDCYYCGNPPNNLSQRKGQYGDFVYSGLDRVDNKIGYTVGNCVPCCATCNGMKSDLTSGAFLDHVKKIYKRNGEKQYGNIAADKRSVQRQSYRTCS